MPEPRTCRLTEHAHAIFKNTNSFPQQFNLLLHFDDKKPTGRSRGVSAAIRKREFVTRPVAKAFVGYIKGNQNEFPSEIIKILTSTSDALGGLFEEFETNTFKEQNEKNDPAMGGVGSLVAAAIKFVFSVSWRPPTLEAIEQRPTPEEYSRYARTYVGYSLSKKDTYITNEEAYQIGLKYLNEPKEFLIKIAPKLYAASPYSIMYAMSKGGDRVGLTVAYAITDEAYEATLQGEREMFGHSSNDMLSHGNNLVLAGYYEIIDSSKSSSDRTRRIATQSSMLTQLALLLDPEDRKPIRCISYDLVDVNTNRLRRLGFVPVTDQSGNPIEQVYMDKLRCQTVVYDPSTMPVSNITQQLRQSAMMAIDDVLWRIRVTVDKILALPE